MTEKTLHQVFAENFERSDIEGAKKWAAKWNRELDQELPGIGCISQRAMAGHISDYLEGFDGSEPDSYNGSHGKTYMATKYGPTIYWAL